ncbi:MAG: hypothetical protein ACKPB3_03185 [Bacteroidota bacterium]
MTFACITDLFCSQGNPSLDLNNSKPTFPVVGFIPFTTTLISIEEFGSNLLEKDPNSNQESSVNATTEEFFI